MVRNKICVYLSGLLRHGLLRCRRRRRDGAIADGLREADGAERLLGAQETIQQIDLLGQYVGNELRVDGSHCSCGLIASYTRGGCTPGYSKEICLPPPLLLHLPLLTGAKTLKMNGLASAPPPSKILQMSRPHSVHIGLVFILC